MAGQYNVLTGPDGEHDSYRFTILDACVVKELRDLFHRGLPGVANPDERNRLKRYLYTHGSHMEIFAGEGARELAWRPLLGSFDVTHFQTSLAIVDYLNHLSARDWRLVATQGVIPQTLDSARAMPRYSEIDFVDFVDFPMFIADISILAKAWDLATMGVTWQESLYQFRDFCADEIRWCPALPLMAAVCLLAGNSRKADWFRKLLKFGPELDSKARADRTRSAAWDLHLLSSIVKHPTVAMTANQEDLRPTSALTADKALIQIHRTFTRFLTEAEPGKKKLVLDFAPTDFFSLERIDYVRGIFSDLDAAQDTRRNTSEEIANETRESMMKAREALGNCGDHDWDDYVDLIDRRSDAWWHAHTPGHSSNRYAREHGWYEHQ